MDINPDALQFCGNLFIRRAVFPAAGDCLPGHRHAFEHVTFVSQGQVGFRQHGTDTPLQNVTAPGFIPTPAEVEHDLIALEPNTCVWCVFALRDDAGSVLVSADTLSTNARMGLVR